MHTETDCKVSRILKRLEDHPHFRGRTHLLQIEAIGGSVVVSVTDTGRGIEPEDQEKVFEMYYRSKRAGGTKGSGLGLAIVKAVATAHGGRVELTSQPGKGSTFRLILPTKTG